MQYIHQRFTLLRMDQNSPVAKVIEKLGGRRAAAAAIGIKPQAIQKWVKRERVPIDRVAQVEGLTGIPRHVLRPDIFGEAA